MDLQKTANISQIVGLAPGFYCAYGTWVTLQQIRSGAERPVQWGAGVINPTGLLISLFLCAGLMGLASLLRLISRPSANVTALTNAGPDKSALYNGNIV